MTNLPIPATSPKFEKLKLSLRYFLLGKGWYRAADALEYFGTIHTGYRKDKKTPEYQHQVEIALYICTILPGLMYPEDTIIAILGHDAPEDYGIKIAALSERFGERPAHAMFLMDKNGKTEEAYYFGIGEDPIASIAKGGDRHHNIRTMPGAFTKEKQIRYAEEVRTHFLPMLKRGRRNFPQQVHCYENIKHVLTVQLELLDALNGSNQPSET